jgi:hypothetical protein
MFQNANAAVNLPLLMVAIVMARLPYDLPFVIVQFLFIYRDVITGVEK